MRIGSLDHPRRAGCIAVQRRPHRSVAPAAITEPRRTTSQRRAEAALHKAKGSGGDRSVLA